MQTKFVMEKSIVMMDLMKLRSFVIESSVLRVNFDVTMEPVYQNLKNAMEFVIVLMVLMKFNVAENRIVVGEFERELIVIK